MQRIIDLYIEIIDMWLIYRCEAVVRTSGYTADMNAKCCLLVVSNEQKFLYL